jgi:hypothetical protein
LRARPSSRQVQNGQPAGRIQPVEEAGWKRVRQVQDKSAEPVLEDQSVILLDGQ